MVALSGRGWILAPCLVDLVEETDRRFPLRSTASDGSIGDPAHATRTSDHNPDNGYVHALDLTDDDAHGCDITLLFAHLVASRDRRVKYLIHTGTIWKSYASNGLKAWTPQVYTGTNAHKLHGHISVKDGEENTPGAWWPTSPAASLEDDDMPLIIKAEGKPARLFAPPVFAPLDAGSAKNLRTAGVREVVVTVADYDEIRDQIIKALGS